MPGLIWYSEMDHRPEEQLMHWGSIVTTTAMLLPAAWCRPTRLDASNPKRYIGVREPCMCGVLGLRKWILPDAWKMESSFKGFSDI